jgi:transcription elongation factor Elf1
MNEFPTINCPHCGERFQISVETDDGNAEFVVDCEICCRPMTVSVRVKAGTVENVEISPA